jgi:hypothetical protein
VHIRVGEDLFLLLEIDTAAFTDSPILSSVATSIPIAKMSRGSSSACCKDVKVVHVAEPVKKKSASAAAAAGEMEECLLSDAGLWTAGNPRQLCSSQHTLSHRHWKVF